ncbi:helix-turn-helix domain-containing GNAT family N-acetyltransferase [soil metagenome]
MTPDPIAAIRGFNRFYTRRIGVLEEAYLGTPLSVAEGRVLYEIAQAPEGLTPKAISGVTGLDAGYLSRILKRFEREALTTRAPSPEDGRSITITLAAKGAETFSGLDAASNQVVGRIIEGLDDGQRGRLTRAMTEVRSLLDPGPAPEVILRPHRPGDMGWIIEQHGEVYTREFGWDSRIESLTARVCADFLDNFDPTLEHCWIAERGGERLGSIFLVKGEEPGQAKLRLLMLTPAARGLGLGKRLVAECVAFARTAGYAEVVLWTHAVLVAARGIYAAAGFEMIDSWTHADLGPEQVSETWRLTL